MRRGVDWRGPRAAPGRPGDRTPTARTGGTPRRARRRARPTRPTARTRCRRASTRRTGRSRSSAVHRCVTVSSARSPSWSSGRIGRTSIAVEVALNGVPPPRRSPPSGARRAQRRAPAAGRRAASAIACARGVVGDDVDEWPSRADRDGTAGTSTASLPPPNRSWMPPTSVATTGTPSVSASIIAIGSPS